MFARPLPGALEEANREISEARDDFVLGQSQPAVARKRLEAELLRTPVEWVAKPLMDIEMSQGDFVSAYKVAVPFVKAGATRDFLLHASLAAAKCGEVYAGQRDFLVSYLIGGSDPADVLPFLPTGDSPDVIATLSACAVGGEVSIHHVQGEALPFYEMARSFDPTNPLFCAGAAACLGELSQYSHAIKVLSQAYPRARTGYMHDQLLGMIRGFRGAIKAVGDGHPLYPVPKSGAGPQTIKP